MLGRLRKLVFNIRHRSSTPHFLESMRRLNRFARLMTIVRRAATAGEAGLGAYELEMIPQP